MPGPSQADRSDRASICVKVTALAQFGNGQFHGSRARVPLTRAIAVAVVDALVADLAVLGVAESVRLRRHQRIGERLDHRAQQVGTRRARQAQPLTSTYTIAMNTASS